MGKYTYLDTDNWQWLRAGAQDVADIVRLADTNYSEEITKIFTKNPTRLTYHLQQAILEQQYLPDRQLVSVARHRVTDQLLAWSWVERGKYTVYADEEMAVAEFLHTDLGLTLRTRMRLTAQALEQWIAWAEICQIPVLVSTSIRDDQSGFMRLHDQFGFVRRGSFAYRKIGTV